MKNVADYQTVADISTMFTTKSKKSIVRPLREIELLEIVVIKVTQTPTYYGTDKQYRKIAK